MGHLTIDGLFEYLPSFAHGSSDAFVKDPMNTISGAGRLQRVILLITAGYGVIN